MSWIKRVWRRLLVRMVHEKAPPEFVARGWAIGMFYGCTIPFGFQLILSIPTALALKGSKVGATLGTLITNQFTIFIIYPVQCCAGNLVLQLFGCNVASVSAIVSELQRIGSLSMFSADFWQGIAALGGGMVASFFIGGALLALVCVPPTYFGVLRFVRLHRVRSDARRARRRAERLSQKENLNHV